MTMSPPPTPLDVTDMLDLGPSALLHLGRVQPLLPSEEKFEFDRFNEVFHDQVNLSTTSLQRIHTHPHPTMPGPLANQARAVYRSLIRASNETFKGES